MNDLILLSRPLDESVGETLDCQAIQKSLHESGYHASVPDIHWAWHEHSQSMAAGWMRIDHDDIAEAAGRVMYYLKEEPV